MLLVIRMGSSTIYLICNTVHVCLFLNFLTFHHILQRFARQMNKTIFVLLCLVGITMSLKISHLQDTTPQASPNTTVSEELPPPPPKSRAEQQAEKRMMRFLMTADNGTLLTSLMTNTTTPAQMKKLIDWMIDDKFYGMQMIKNMTSSPDNRWMKVLSFPAQKRFMKIVTSVPLDKIDDPATMQEVVKKLYSDKEIGRVLKKEFGTKGLPQNFLEGTKGLQSAAGGSAHHLVSFAAII